jgi:8-oxo-dGTP diphosphatase
MPLNSANGEADLTKPYPLSHAQTGVYFECMKNPTSTLYNIPMRARLPLEISDDALRAAVEQVVNNHPELFVHFRTNDTGVEQVIESQELIVDRRELKEETGLDTPIRFEELKSFSTVDRDPRGRTISVAFVAEVPLSEVKGGDDAAEARWFPLDEIPQLAFDHGEMLQAALERLGIGR